MKVAVFDIGTNTIHMLIAKVKKDRSFEILSHEKDVTRLGDGSFKTRRYHGDDGSFVEPGKDRGLPPF